MPPYRIRSRTSDEGVKGGANEGRTVKRRFGSLSRAIPPEHREPRENRAGVRNPLAEQLSAWIKRRGRTLKQMKTCMGNGLVHCILNLEGRPLPYPFLTAVFPLSDS